MTPPVKEYDFLHKWPHIIFCPSIFSGNFAKAFDHKERDFLQTLLINFNLKQFDNNNIEDKNLWSRFKVTNVQSQLRSKLLLLSLLLRETTSALLLTSGANLVNRFPITAIYQLWNRALWLGVSSHVRCVLTNQRSLFQRGRF